MLLLTLVCAHDAQDGFCCSRCASLSESEKDLGVRKFSRANGAWLRPMDSTDGCKGRIGTGGEDRGCQGGEHCKWHGVKNPF
jgi:hypothetical protein